MFRNNLDILLNFFFVLVLNSNYTQIVYVNILIRPSHTRSTHYPGTLFVFQIPRRYTEAYSGSPVYLRCDALSLPLIKLNLQHASIPV